ncbi:hypothetical protein [Neptunomonas sp.]|uniref:hypothetical protein n=1 Tax=Neptunomonas sp. TaxID=1971898 RepID=UPI00356611EF
MPAVGGRQPFIVSYRDYSGETKTVRLYMSEITALTLPDLLADMGDLKNALDAVTLGVRAREHWGEETIVSNARAESKNAQIETELLVRCQGATSEAPFSFRIPTVDYTAFNYADPPAGDQVILSGAGATAATTALVAAIEALGKMPNNESEGIVVVGMEVVR